MRAKQKIVQGRGPSNINLGIFVCSFDACWASYLVSSINYARGNIFLEVTTIAKVPLLTINTFISSDASAELSP